MQTQSATKPLYTGPFDAVKKIASQHGITGVFKGQTATFMREGLGFSVYFLAYEKLIQREMQMKNIRREDIAASNTILYGAAAGYAVSSPPPTFLCNPEMTSNNSDSYGLSSIRLMS